MVNSIALDEVKVLLKPIWGITKVKTLTVPATLDALDQIAEFIGEVAGSLALDNTATYNLQLAAGELATNIISHGYQENNLSGELEFVATIRDESLAVVIEDTAVAFDPLQMTEPDLDLPLADRPIGGLGIFLVQESVDDFLYERVGNRNRNILIVKRKPAMV
jgi:anti-sigma regulatory factor (Ser/Thr protein kinase)